jgi:hypothetical protein
VEPKGRKGRKEEAKIFFRTWRAWRPFDAAAMLCEKNIRIRDVERVGQFAQAAKTLNLSQYETHEGFAGRFETRPFSVACDDPVR